MKGVNKVILVGYVALDPEAREATGGSQVTFRIATYRGYPYEGERKDVIDFDFFRVVAWGKLGERCAKRLSLGQDVYVEGTLQEGKRAHEIEVRADEICLLTWEKKSGIETTSLHSIQGD